MNPIRRGLAKAFGFLFLKAAGYNSTVTSGLTPMSPELARLLGGAPSAAGKTVNETTAMALSAAWACMRIISESLGMLPWNIYRRDEKGNSKRADDHPLASVLVGSPNRDMTSVEFRECKGLNLCQTGAAYSFVERLAGQVSSLYPIQSALVQMKQKKGSNTTLNLPEGAVFFTLNDRGKYDDYPREKIWHVKGFGNNGLQGLSPLGAARESMGLALATDEFGALFFSQGGRPSGIVTTDKWLSKENREIARENLTQMLGGAANAHKFALFEGGMTVEPWGNMPLQDMEFVTLRRFNVQEICRFYRIPPHMVADLEKGASYASIEQMSSEFVMFTLMPYFTRFESSVSKWLMTPEDRAKGYFLRFNYEGLLRADAKARSEFFSSAVQNGWMSRNEVRAKENMNAVDGLDTFTAQTNLAPVDQLGAIAAANAAKPAQQPPAASEPMKVAPVANGLTQVDVHLPEKIEHKFQPALLDLATSVRTLAEATTKAQRDLAAIVESGNTRLADQIIDGHASLARRLTDGQGELAKSLGESQTAVASALRSIAEQEREITVGGETFVSKPAKRRDA